MDKEASGAEFRILAVAIKAAIFAQHGAESIRVCHSHSINKFEQCCMDVPLLCYSLKGQMQVPARTGYLLDAGSTSLMRVKASHGLPLDTPLIEIGEISATMLRIAERSKRLAETHRRKPRSLLPGNEQPLGNKLSRLSGRSPWGFGYSYFPIHAGYDRGCRRSSCRYLHAAADAMAPDSTSARQE